MSGIYIPGMEMPTGCDTCPFENFGDCYGGKAKRIMDIDEEMALGIRHRNCPLVAVPDHGRLADLDELLKEAMFAQSNEELLTAIEQALTIIPADREDGE